MNLVVQRSHGYLHGYSESEQERLGSQARFLEPYVFERVDLSQCHHLLEVGCGVGAQTEILCERFPEIHITAIDREPKQIEKAARRLKEYSSRVNLEVCDARQLPYTRAKFDGAFLCWVLEHVEDPSTILREVARTLKRNGRIYVTEVLNAPLVVHPPSQSIVHYWAKYNEHQADIGGDPVMGLRLCDLLHQEGFRKIDTHTISYELDRRTGGDAQRNFFEYWQSLFLSASSSLLTSGVLTTKDVDAMSREFEILKGHPKALFFLVARQVTAVK